MQLHDSHSVKSSEPRNLLFSQFSKPNSRHVSRVRILPELLFDVVENGQYILEGPFKYVKDKHMNSQPFYQESHPFTTFIFSISDTLTASATPYARAFHEVFYIKLNWCPRLSVATLVGNWALISVRKT